MSRFLKSFAELSSELVAIDTIADRNISSQFPASPAEAASPGAAAPPEQPTERTRAALPTLMRGTMEASTNDRGRGVTGA